MKKTGRPYLRGLRLKSPASLIPTFESGARDEADWRRCEEVNGESSPGSYGDGGGAPAEASIIFVPSLERYGLRDKNEAIEERCDAVLRPAASAQISTDEIDDSIEER